MIRWLLAKILRRTYFKAVDPEGRDYGCVQYGYLDRHNILHITKVKYLVGGKEVNGDRLLAGLHETESENKRSDGEETGEAY
jgi:hypothetical protein